MRILLTDKLSHTEEFDRHLKAAMPAAEFRRWPLGDPSWNYDLLVSWQLPDDLYALPESVRAVFCFGAGADNLLNDPRIPADIPIAKLQDDGQAQQMLDYAQHVALSWLQNDNTYRLAQRDRKWLRHPDEIRTRTAMRITVLGLGHLGQRTAMGLADAGFTVSAWSRSGRDLPSVTTYAGWDQLIAAVGDANLLVNLLPLTPETRNILNGKLFAVLSRGAYIVNLGRGDHLNDADILDALDTGAIDCAWLDVFREEPLPVEHAFWSHPHIRMTPHMAAIPTALGTSASIARIVEAMETGAPLPNAVR